MSTQVFVASTAFGLATVVAALEDGAFEAADRRILLLSNNAAVPETASGVEEVAGISALLQRFDTTHHYNEVIAPQHPSVWRPRAVDLPILERYLTERWGLTDDLHLVVESIQVSPAQTLGRIFSDARIDVYADGLMSYGPTRSKLPALLASRIERLLHLDLVPGLAPVLLTEHRVPPRIVSTDAFRKVMADLAPPPAVVRDAPSGQVAVLLGQYLSALGILTVDEEAELHVDMLRGAVAAGFDRVIFKPHPSAPPMLDEPLQSEAERCGTSLTVHSGPELVETWFRAESVGCVIGCFSTALITAAACYNLPVARVGTELLLDRLRPYQNSNRIPVTLVDALVPPVAQLGRRSDEVRAWPAVSRPAELEALVHTVSYNMQPERYPGLRPVAEQLLRRRGQELQRYVKRRRLTKLDLPGGFPPLPPPGLRRRMQSALRRLPAPVLRRLLRWATR